MPYHHNQAVYSQSVTISIIVNSWQTFLWITVSCLNFKTSLYMKVQSSLDILKISVVNWPSKHRWSPSLFLRAIKRGMKPSSNNFRPSGVPLSVLLRFATLFIFGGHIYVWELLITIFEQTHKWQELNMPSDFPCFKRAPSSQWH